MTEKPKETLEQETFSSLPSEATLKEERPTKEAWEAYSEKIVTLYDEVYKKAESLYGANGARLLRNKTCDFRDRIPQKELNPSDYIAWHKIIGSGTNQKMTPLLDMPKPYSVEDFLLKLKDDLDITENCQKYMDKGFHE